MVARGPMPGELAQGVVHVWRITLDEVVHEYQSLVGLLTDDEKERAHKYKFRRDRHRFVAGRAGLRAILGSYVSCSPAMLRFEYGAAGKPSLRYPASPTPVQFNLSHSGGIGLLAVARQTVGIDVELVRTVPDVEEIAKSYFSATEQRELLQLPVPLRSAGFLNCWTRKEAFVKAIGDGLSLPLDSFDVSLTPGAPVELRQIRGKGSTDRWRIMSVPVGDNAIAAVVAESPLVGLECRDWSFQEVPDHTKSL